MTINQRVSFAVIAVAFLAVSGLAAAQLAFTKAQVGDRIRKVEDGVDEFRKWSENRAEQGKSTAQAAKTSPRARGRTATEPQKEVAKEKKDELDDSLGDLNRSTNRLRRQFDPTDKWMETRPQVFDARHVGGHELSQIDLERNLSCACAEQFRNLRDTQTAGEPDDASIGLLNDADPALHALLKRKTQATNEGILLRKAWLDATLTSYLTAGRDSSHDPLNAVGATSVTHTEL